MPDLRWKYGVSGTGTEKLVLYRGSALIAQIYPIHRDEKSRLMDEDPFITCFGIELDDVFPSLDAEGIRPEDRTYLAERRDSYMFSPYHKREDGGIEYTTRQNIEALEDASRRDIAQDN